MKVKHIITICGIVAGGVGLVNGAKALNYEDTADVQFTFNSQLNMELSSNALTITDLAPGNAKDSNVVDVTVHSNNLYGYTLNAKVGNSTYTDATLKHTGGAAEFTSMANAAATVGAGEWGYAMSTDGTSYGTVSGGTFTANTYKGLTYNSDTTVRATENGAKDSVTNFKINAHATDSQLAGTYNNVITFTAVSNVDTGD